MAVEQDVENGTMTAELALVDRPSAGLALTFDEMVLRVRAVDDFYRQVLKEGTDYGVIPGTDKPTLYQSGAQMLDQLFGLSPSFEVLPSSTIDWDRQPAPFFDLMVRCTLTSRRTGEVVAEGIGSCNTHEDRYRWRNSRPACLECGADLFRAKDRPEYFCWRKRGGCGATFPLQVIPAGGRVENEDTASLQNTILKMSQKRAHVCATLNATGASRIFTQDVEDLPVLSRPDSRTASPPADAWEPEPEPPQNRSQSHEEPSEPVRRGWTPQAESKWAQGAMAAVKLGIVQPLKPPADADRETVVGALKELGSAVERGQAIGALKDVVRIAVENGVNVNVPADIDTMPIPQIREMTSAVHEVLPKDNGDEEIPF